MRLLFLMNNVHTGVLWNLVINKNENLLRNHAMAEWNQGFEECKDGMNATK